MVHITPEKRCGKCKVVKLASLFSRCRSSRDGLQGRCKACDNAVKHEQHVRNSRRVVEIPSEKRCGKCKVNKPADQFNHCRSKVDGLQGRCKVCDKIARRDQSVRNRRDWARREALQGNAASRKVSPRKRQRRRPLVLPTEKRCPRCELVKSANQFHRSRSVSGGLQGWCKDCANEARIKATYGITKRQLQLLLDEQGGACAICRRTPDVAGTLHVDHDHETGAVRGLLCSSCNHAIGMARDNPDVLVRAGVYVSDPSTVLLLAMGVKCETVSGAKK